MASSIERGGEVLLIAAPGQSNLMASTAAMDTAEEERELPARTTLGRMAALMVGMVVIITAMGEEKEVALMCKLST